MGIRQDEPPLLAEWVAALRLATLPGEVRDADELAGRLLQAGEAALRSGAPALPGT